MSASFLDNRKMIAKAWGQWTEEHFYLGHDVNHLIFTFDAMGTSERAIVERMKRAVERFYTDFITRFNKWPDKQSRAHFNPSLVWFPDRPDAKSKKVSLEQAKMNAGVHGHALSAALHRPQTKDCLNTRDVIERDQAIFCRNGIAHIEAIPVTHHPCEVASYACKSFRSGFFDDQDVLAFPRSITELSKDKIEEYWRQVEVEEAAFRGKWKNIR